jgi:hypothetical protein
MSGLEHTTQKTTQLASQQDTTNSRTQTDNH